jgi:hypothetical protein
VNAPKIQARAAVSIASSCSRPCRHSACARAGIAAGSAAATEPSQARAPASAWVALAGVGAVSGWHTWSVTPDPSSDHLFEFIRPG